MRMNGLSPFGLFVWSLATLFFIFEMSLQVFLGMVAPEFIKDLQLQPEQFAFLGSSFYIAYAIMQPNVGILCDRFSVKSVILTAITLCIVGAYLLQLSNGFYSALLARTLIGFGSSCAFIPILIISLNWFPKSYFGFFVGGSQLLGALGPLFAGGPAAILMKHFGGDWRQIVFGMSLFGILLLVITALFMKDRPKGKSHQVIFLEAPTDFFSNARLIFKNRQIWWISIYAGLVYVTIPLLGAYWGSSYLQSRAFTKEESAFIVSMIWVGVAFSSPLIGIISDKIARRKIPMIVSPILGIVSILAILYLPIKNVFLLSSAFFFLGISASGQSLSFALVAENVPKKLRSFILGFNNFFIIAIIAIIPPLVTWIMQMSAKTHSRELITTDFQSGFILIPCFYGIALLISFFKIKETFCKSQYEMHKVTLHRSSDILETS